MRFIAAQNGGYVRGSLVLHALGVGKLEAEVRLSCVMKKNNALLAMPQNGAT